MPKAKTSTKGAKKTINPLYKVNGLTKNSDRKLWVTFKKGRPSTGLVFSSTLTRDKVRSAAARILNVEFADVRSRRVRSYRKIVK